MFDHRGYLLDLRRRIPKPRLIREIVDILSKYRYNEFYVLTADDNEAREEMDILRLESYCRMQDLKFVELDEHGAKMLVADEDCVSVATESARSLAGRVEEMRERMERAEEDGRRRGCSRFLVTDFSDECAWHPLVISLPAIILGGAFASSGAKSAKMDLELELNRTLGAPVGGVLLRLGTLYLRGGAVRSDRSEYFNILSSDHGYSRHSGITQVVLEDVSGLAHGCRIAAEKWLDRSDWSAEIAYVAMLLDAAANRRDERRLRELRDEHSRLWRLRYLEFGRVESLARLPRF